MDCSPSGSSVHRISQARILEWVAISFSRGSSQPKDLTQVSCIGRQILYHVSHQGSPQKNLGFPCGSAGKEFAHNSGDLGLIPGLGRSPGEGQGYPLQYSGLENSMGCIVHGVAKSQTQHNTHSLTFLVKVG